MTLLESLLALNPYPLDPEAIRPKVWGRGLHPEDNFCHRLSTDPAYQLARADVLMLLSLAPNVTQEGISYSFSDAQRADLAAQARQIYRRYLPTDDPLYPKGKPRYGYAGSLLKR